MTMPISELNQIMEALRAGEKEEAVAVLRQVLKHDPYNVQALVWLGGLTHHMREGIIALERALQLDPENEAAGQTLDRLRALQVGGELVARWRDQNTEQLIRRRNHRLAILVDGDNARPVLIGEIFREAQKYGSLQIRRIYGDWTKPSMNGWKRILHTHAIQPIQQFHYTTGKNATDGAMIIDAMDILHTGQVDGFCLVSSDSDYTRLATRIAENGIFVMGIGRKKTPRAFVNACALFVYTENFLSPPLQPTTKKRTNGMQDCKQQNNQEAEVITLLEKAFEQAVQTDGKAYLGTMGICLQQLDPTFQPRKYGYKQLSQLIRAHGKFFKTETIASKIYVELKG